MNPFTFEAFETDARQRGFDTVMVREWAPATVVGAHGHPFIAHALLVQGEMWLTVGESTRHLSVGDVFDLPADVIHSERYGAHGAVYWVARKTAEATDSRGG